MVGAPKSATTSLFQALRQHPGFDLSGPKEPGFFCYRSARFIVSDRTKVVESLPYLVTEGAFEAAYSTLMPGRLWGDFTTHYLYWADTFVSRVRSAYGERRGSEIPIVVVLRHPVDRAFSHYVMKRRDAHETLAFVDAISDPVVSDRLELGYVPTFDYLGFSKYESRIERLAEYFSRVMVVDFRELTRAPERVLASVCDLVGASTFPRRRARLQQHNASGLPASRGLRRAVAAALFRSSRWKGWVPVGVRAPVGRALKRTLGAKVLEPATLSAEDRAHAERRLSAEVAFYEAVFAAGDGVILLKG